MQNQLLNNQLIKYKSRQLIKSYKCLIHRKIMVFQVQEAINMTCQTLNHYMKE